MKIIYVIFAVIFIGWVVISGKRRQRKGKTLKEIEIDTEKCARCQSCIAKCRHHVLEMTNDDGQKRVSVVHPELCTGCGNCRDVCRFGALQLVPRKND